jgi:hypothetical protein
VGRLAEVMGQPARFHRHKERQRRKTSLLIFVLIFKLHSSNNIIYSAISFFWQDVYNFMLDSGMDPVALPVGSSSLMSSLQDSQPGSNTIDGIMNGVIKQKLKIIPKNFTYVSP